MTTTAPAIRVGRLPVDFDAMGYTITRPLHEVANGTTVLATATITRIQRHGARATVVLAADNDTIAALRIDADGMRTFAHRITEGATVTVRGYVDRLDGGMPVIDLGAVLPAAPAKAYTCPTCCAPNATQAALDFHADAAH